ncbi:MAG TPA: OmpA family protein [Candidatus Sulfotelmatobacter sp.]|nr:OmpA family protein [Candidatus Sulfotelmatobacter sp.]
MRTRSVMLWAIVAGLFAAGCATKQFVRTELGERDAQLGRLETNVGENQTNINRIDGQLVTVKSRAEDANKLAEQAAGIGSQAQRRADEAGTKAGQALAKAEDTDSRFSRAWTNRNRRNAGETIMVHFGFDKADLDDRAQTALLEAVNLLKADPNLFVTLEGFTDSIGAAGYNLQLSQRRAESVRRFMVQNGVDLHRIQSIGLGEAPSTAKVSRKREEDRRVAVHLMTPVD